jgi:hypothetical protein
MADFVRDTETIESLLRNGLYSIMIKIAAGDDLRVREQAVYCVLKGFGLGTAEQKKKLTDIEGLAVVLKFTVIAVEPFNCHLMDCLEALVGEDFEYYSTKLRDIGVVKVLYQLLIASDSVVSSKAANLLGLVGDDYELDFEQIPG